MTTNTTSTTSTINKIENYIVEAWNDFDNCLSTYGGDGSYERNKSLKNKDIISYPKCCDDFYHTEYEGCIVCVNCGVVQEVGIIIDVPDFCEISQVSHTKTNIFFPKSSGATIMSGKSNLSKMQNWNSMPYNERVLWEVSNTLKIKLTDYFQPRIIDDAISNFKELDDKKDETGKKEIHRGKIRDGLIACCVYFACKSRGINKTPLQIATIMDVDITTFKKCTRIYNNILETKQEVINCVDFVELYYSTIREKYEISYKIQNTTKKICQEIEEMNIFKGTIPQNITAGCILFTSMELGLEIDPEYLVDKYSISLNTLKKNTSIISSHKIKIYTNILQKKKNENY